MMMKKAVPPHARWSNLISNMSWCASVSTVLACFTGELFPDPIFVLFLIEVVQNFVDLVKDWGDVLPIYVHDASDYDDGNKARDCLA